MDRIGQVAEGLSDQQVQMNTADALSQINASDQNQLGQFDVSALGDQTGGQIDASKITNALQDRTRELRNIARQDASDTRAEEAFGLKKEKSALDAQVAALSMQRTQQQIDQTNKSVQQQQQATSAINNIMGNLHSFSTPEELNQEILRTGQANNLNPTEISNLINGANTTWNSTIGVQGPQSELITERTAEAQELLNQYSVNASQELDRQAADKGYNLDMLKLGSGERATETQIFDTFKGLMPDDQKAANQGALKFMKAYQNQFPGRLPTVAEAEYFVTAGLTQGWGFGAYDKVDNKKLTSALQEYDRQTGSGAGAEWYRNGRETIAAAQSDSLKKLASDTKGMRTRSIENNQKRFNGEEFTPLTEQDFNPVGYVPDVFQNTSWMNPPAADVPQVQSQVQARPASTNSITKFLQSPFVAPQDPLIPNNTQEMQDRRNRRAQQRIANLGQ